jgi:hypothetical protein
MAAELILDTLDNLIMVYATESAYASQLDGVAPVAFIALAGKANDCTVQDFIAGVDADLIFVFHGVSPVRRATGMVAGWFD